MSGDPTRFPVDLSNCDREPIHLLGRIQDVGFLIAVSMDWMVQHVSANLGERFGRPAGDIAGLPLVELLPEQAIHAIRGRLQILSNSEGSERLFGFDLFGKGERFDIAIHVSQDTVIIEAEPSPASSAVNPASLMKSVMARIGKTTTPEALYRECVRQLRAVTGFDRVMLYRFADGGAGNVIAESARSGIGTFLGLNYPATDIPAQARALYIRNQIRSIADVDAPTIPIEPALDIGGRPLDLSMSVLRSVSPIHVEYLRNMGVSASLSVSIVIDEKLWGLFALHHYSPRHLPMELRSATELFGQMISLVIEGRLAKERRLADETARLRHDRFIAKLASASGSIESIADFAEELGELIPHDGFAILMRGDMKLFGRGPTRDEIPGLARFLNRAASSRVFATRELGAIHPPAADYVDRAAGVLAIPISRSPRDYILFFRQEIARTVVWAGDPAGKEMTHGPNGPRLTPRKSFEAWKETVHGQSMPWTDGDLKAAEALRISILEVLVRFNEESERQQSLATQRQELLIAELNHRVRNILSLIRALIAQSRAGAKSVEEFASIIGGRIQALARAHDQLTNENFSSQPLAEIINTEVQAYIGQKGGRVRLDGPPVLIEASAFSTLALVFHELVTNSAKYGALSDSSGSVAVGWSIDENESCVVSWRETGGPPVAPPTRRGFGSTIIERSIPHDLGGEAALTYKLSGLEARFVLPPSVFERSTQERIAAAGRVEAGRLADVEPGVVEALDGLTALVVEDNMIISLDTEELLIAKGAKRVLLATSVAEGRSLAQSEAVDFAILDVNLGNETSFPLASEFAQAGLPFLFVTGYGERIDFPTEGGPHEAIKKPFGGPELMGAISRALARGKARGHKPRPGSDKPAS